jgi:hypothetical protein
MYQNHVSGSDNSVGPSAVIAVFMVGWPFVKTEMLHGLNHEKETSNVNVSGVHTGKTRSKTCGAAITTMVLLI